MEFIERDLEEIIYFAYKNEESRDMIIDRGLDIHGEMLRQLDLGGYGKADLVTMSFEDPDGCFLLVNVIELKKDLIDHKALSQACRYVKGLKRYFEKNSKFDKLSVSYKITLIGKSISHSDDFVYLYNECYNFCDIYTYKYWFDGIHFEYEEPCFIRNQENLEIIDQKLEINLENGTIKQK